MFLEISYCRDRSVTTFHGYKIALYVDQIHGMQQERAFEDKQLAPKFEGSVHPPVILGLLEACALGDELSCDEISSVRMEFCRWVPATCFGKSINEELPLP